MRDGQFKAALDFAATQKALPKETATDLVLLQARLSHLENERTAGTLENAAYTARYNEITKSFLAIVEELES